MTEDEAKAAVLQVLPPDRTVGEETVVRARDFPAGWLVTFQRADGQHTVGGSTYVVDGEDGSIRSFGSGTPPRRVIDNYPDFKQRVAPL